MQTYEDRKQKKVEIFEDTERCYTTKEELVDSVKVAIAATTFYPAGSALPEVDGLEKPAVVTVSKKKSLQAAYDYLVKNPNARVCVHNFASATHPGGGVKWGSSAQEECLCRCTMLYPCLNTNELYKNIMRIIEIVMIHFTQMRLYIRLESSHLSQIQIFLKHCPERTGVGWILLPVLRLI